MKLFVVLFCVATSLLAGVQSVPANRAPLFDLSLFGKPASSSTARPGSTSTAAPTTIRTAGQSLINTASATVRRVVELPAVRPATRGQIDAFLNTLFPGSAPAGGGDRFGLCPAITLDDCKTHVNSYPANQGLTADFNCALFLGLVSSDASTSSPGK